MEGKECAPPAQQDHACSGRSSTKTIPEEALLVTWMKTALVFDDEPELLASTQKELAGHFNVIVVPDFASGLAIAREHELDVAIAHMNSTRGRAGVEFMVEVAHLRPSCRRLLYSRWDGGRADALNFAH